MHPLFATRARLLLYLVAWSIIAVILALLVGEERVVFLDALFLTTMPTLVFAFVSMAAWFPVRALPLRPGRAAQVTLAHIIGAILFGGLLLLLFQTWGRLIARTDIVEVRTSAIVITGALLYLLSVGFHYLFVAVDAAYQLEKREIEVQVLAREAELKALKAQLDPHFLFNSLNSISSLCGSNPSSARTLTILLADYLRRSLRIGNASTITLSEELELASSYLAIERIRFGPRLDLQQEIDESIRSCAVPPLLLQPLVENAITHGVAHLTEGGTVRIRAQREASAMRIDVENPCDPDRPHREGHGIGLRNTRQRVKAFYGDDAQVEIQEAPAAFRVSLVLPAGGTS